MRAVSGYRPARMIKIKSLLLTALLMAMAFLAGAVAEKTAHFLQDAAAALPAVLDGIKTFLRERFFFKFNAAVDQARRTAAIILAMATEQASCLIRGP
ncbi:MAG: hypothetical protein K6T29_07630 [Peptococcaceae bacterium]|nr:hypothetical protein [Peptococcaceae bacterium]